MAKDELKVNDLPRHQLKFSALNTGKLGAIMEVSYNGAFEIDEQGKFLYANPAFLGTFGLESADVKGFNFYEVVSSPG